MDRIDAEGKIGIKAKTLPGNRVLKGEFCEQYQMKQSPVSI